MRSFVTDGPFRHARGASTQVDARNSSGARRKERKLKRKRLDCCTLLEEIPATGVPSSAAAFSNIDPDLVGALYWSQPIDDTLTPLLLYSNRVRNTSSGLLFADKTMMFVDSPKPRPKIVSRATLLLSRSEIQLAKTVANTGTLKSLRTLRLRLRRRWLNLFRPTIAFFV